MKKLLSFIPLGIGISALIIYIFNVISFRVINNGATNLQILSNLKIYLYLAIAGFIIYFIIKILEVLSNKKGSKLSEEEKEDDQKSYEPFEIDDKKDDDIGNNINIENKNVYVPNYDYVPMYHKEVKGNYLAKEEKKDNVIKKENIIDTPKKDDEVLNIEKIKEEKESHVNSSNYCYNCGAKINYSDKYCSSCGALLKVTRKNTNPVLKNIINVIEIVILILIIYFSLNMLFEYKENTDPNFKSPFKISMTK